MHSPDPRLAIRLALAAVLVLAPAAGGAVDAKLYWSEIGASGDRILRIGLDGTGE